MHWSPRVAPIAGVSALVFPRARASRCESRSRGFSEPLSKPLRRRIGAARRSYTWDELLTAVRFARREGSVGAFEYEILSHVLEFREKVVKEIMTPSIHVTSAPVTTPRDELSKLFASSGRSRMPIYGESPDDIIGILHVKDLVDPQSARSEDDLRARMRETFFIPGKRRHCRPLPELQRRKIHVAIVSTSTRSFAGVVTTEDILEQMIGEIHDARDTECSRFSGSTSAALWSQARWRSTISTRCSTPRCATRTRDDCRFRTRPVGRVPREGESMSVGGLAFPCVSAQPNRIRKLRVEKL